MIGLEEVRRAYQNISKYIVRTPTIRSPLLSKNIGAEVYLKLECYQPINVFKIRGALNKILNLSPTEREKGVITASSGNHGLAVAYAAKLFGLEATICVPLDANPAKLSGIEQYDATILKHGSVYDEAYVKALSIQRENGSMFIHAFNDPVVIAGQGTIGLELMEDASGLDTVIVPVGGGGLISGIAATVKSLNPSTKMVGVQVEACPSMYNSWRSRKLLEVSPASTIADGLAAKKPGELTLDHVLAFVDDFVLVNDDELLRAMAFLLQSSRVLAEPAGAAAAAALLFKYRPRQGEKIGLIISGGNISPEVLKRMVSLIPSKV